MPQVSHFSILHLFQGSISFLPHVMGLYREHLKRLGGCRIFANFLKKPIPYSSKVGENPATPATFYKLNAT